MKIGMVISGGMSLVSSAYFLKNNLRVINRNDLRDLELMCAALFLMSKNKIMGNERSLRSKIHILHYSKIIVWI